MKEFLHKIASISLALIVLLSSFSFTVNKHICGGKVVNTTLYVSADTCGMEMNVCKNTPSKRKETSIQKEPCCQDVSTTIQGQENNQHAQSLELNFPQVLFVQAFVYSFVLKYQNTTSISKFVDYAPPLVHKDIQILFQVFRI